MGNADGSDKTFNVFYQNVRGLKTKTHELYTASLTCNYDSLVLTETWLDSSVFDNELLSNDYVIFRTDRNFDLTNTTRGGGVLLALNKSITADSLVLRSDVPSIDIIGIKICFNHRPLYVIALYIPPVLDVASYDIIFSQLMSYEFCRGDQDLLILGDFNIPNYIKFLNNNQYKDNYIDILRNFCEFLNIQQYNQVENSKNRILDLVLSNNTVVVEKSINVLLMRTDPFHPPLEVHLTASLRKKKFSAQCIPKYNFKRADFPRLYQDLAEADFSCILTCNNIHDACRQLYTMLDTIFVRSVPKTVTKNGKYPPWFTGDIIKNIKNKSRLWCSYKKSSNIDELNQFKLLRSSIKNDIDNAYKLYIRNIEIQVQSNPNRFWSYINSKRNTTTIPSIMSYNNMKLNDPQVIVDAFAHFFQEAFIQSSNHQNNLNSSISDAPVLPVPHISEADVLKALKKVKPKCTMGLDGIPAFLLKDCGFLLAKPLSYIFNLSLQTNIFPDVWKIARICPVFKKGDRSIISNYRPIIILSNISKLFEIVLHDVLFYHVKTQLAPYQHGFMPGRSTSTNLAVFTQFVANILDQGGQVDVVYTDFSKAFDRLDHGKLLQKLASFGLTHSFINFFESYLTNRYLTVQYRGFYSVNITATSGVPQGSVLGPLLFIIFIDDIIEDLQCKSLLYADDLKLFTSINNIEDCIALQNDLQSLSRWCSNNNLHLNVNKCHIMSFTRKLSTTEYSYVLNNNELNRCNNFKDLGVLFDTKLSFTDHISDIIVAAYRNLGFIIRNSKQLVDINTLKILFSTFVRSKLEYACVVWNPGYELHKNNIERIQRRFVRYIWFKTDGIYPDFHISHNELLSRFAVKDLTCRREYQTIIMLFKILNNLIDCPDLVKELNFHVPNLQTRSHSSTFYLTAPRTNVLAFSPIYVMCSNYVSVQNNLDIFHCNLRDIKAHFLA